MAATCVLLSDFVVLFRVIGLASLDGSNQQISIPCGIVQPKERNSVLIKCYNLQPHRQSTDSSALFSRTEAISTSAVCRNTSKDTIYFKERLSKLYTVLHLLLPFRRYGLSSKCIVVTHNDMISRPARLKCFPLQSISDIHDGVHYVCYMLIFKTTVPEFHNIKSFHPFKDYFSLNSFSSFLTNACCFPCELKLNGKNIRLEDKRFNLLLKCNLTHGVKRSLTISIASNKIIKRRSSRDISVTGQVTNKTMCSPHCRGVCDRTNGTCQLCAPGYTGSFCNSTCPLGFHGNGCVQECPQFCLENRCHHKTGHCFGCKPGYMGDFCNVQCIAGYYGDHCTNVCSEMCEDQLCDFTSGHCVNCLPGYFGQTCSQICPPDTYGSNCSFQCSDFCRTECNRATGECAECLPGYNGSLCDETCPKGRYGIRCASHCSDGCLNNECSHVEGSCFQCKPLLTGIFCLQRIQLGDIITNSEKENNYTEHINVTKYIVGKETENSETWIMVLIPFVALFIVVLMLITCLINQMAVSRKSRNDSISTLDSSPWQKHKHPHNTRYSDIDSSSADDDDDADNDDELCVANKNGFGEEVSKFSHGPADCKQDEKLKVSEKYSLLSSVGSSTEQCVSFEYHSNVEYRDTQMKTFQAHHTLNTTTDNNLVNHTMSKSGSFLLSKQMIGPIGWSPKRAIQESKITPLTSNESDASSRIGHHDSNIVKVSSKSESAYSRDNGSLSSVSTTVDAAINNYQQKMSTSLNVTFKRSNQKVEPKTDQLSATSKGENNTAITGDVSLMTSARVKGDLSDPEDTCTQTITHRKLITSPDSPRPMSSLKDQRQTGSRDQQSGSPGRTSSKRKDSGETVEFPPRVHRQESSPVRKLSRNDSSLFNTKSLPVPLPTKSASSSLVITETTSYTQMPSSDSSTTLAKSMSAAARQAERETGTSKTAAQVEVEGRGPIQDCLQVGKTSSPISDDVKNGSNANPSSLTGTTRVTDTNDSKDDTQIGFLPEKNFLFETLPYSKYRCLTPVPFSERLFSENPCTVNTKCPTITKEDLVHNAMYSIENKSNQPPTRSDDTIPSHCSQSAETTKGFVSCHGEKSILDSKASHSESKCQDIMLPETPIVCLHCAGRRSGNSSQRSINSSVSSEALKHKEGDIPPVYSGCWKEHPSGNVLPSSETVCPEPSSICSSSPFPLHSPRTSHNVQHRGDTVSIHSGLSTEFNSEIKTSESSAKTLHNSRPTDLPREHSTVAIPCTKLGEHSRAIAQIGSQCVKQLSSDNETLFAETINHKPTTITFRVLNVKRDGLNCSQTGLRSFNSFSSIQNFKCGKDLVQTRYEQANDSAPGTKTSCLESMCQKITVFNTPVLDSLPDIKSTNKLDQLSLNLPPSIQGDKYCKDIVHVESGKSLESKLFSEERTGPKPTLAYAPSSHSVIPVAKGQSDENNTDIGQTEHGLSKDQLSEDKTHSPKSMGLSGQRSYRNTLEQCQLPLSVSPTSHSFHSNRDVFQVKFELTDKRFYRNLVSSTGSTIQKPSDIPIQCSIINNPFLQSDKRTPDRVAGGNVLKRQHLSGSKSLSSENESKSLNQNSLFYLEQDRVMCRKQSQSLPNSMQDSKANEYNKTVHTGLGRAKCCIPDIPMDDTDLKKTSADLSVFNSKTVELNPSMAHQTVSNSFPCGNNIASSKTTVQIEDTFPKNHSVDNDEKIFFTETLSCADRQYCRTSTGAEKSGSENVKESCLLGKLSSGNVRPQHLLQDSLSHISIISTSCGPTVEYRKVVGPTGLEPATNQSSENESSKIESSRRLKNPVPSLSQQTLQDAETLSCVHSDKWNKESALCSETRALRSEKKTPKPLTLHDRLFHDSCSASIESDVERAEEKLPETLSFEKSLHKEMSLYDRLFSRHASKAPEKKLTQNKKGQSADNKKLENVNQLTVESGHHRPMSLYERLFSRSHSSSTKNCNNQEKDTVPENTWSITTDCETLAMPNPGDQGVTSKSNNFTLSKNQDVQTLKFKNSMTLSPAPVVTSVAKSHQPKDTPRNVKSVSGTVFSDAPHQCAKTNCFNSENQTIRSFKNLNKQGSPPPKLAKEILKTGRQEYPSNSGPKNDTLRDDIDDKTFVHSDELSSHGSQIYLRLSNKATVPVWLPFMSSSSATTPSSSDGESFRKSKSFCSSESSCSDLSRFPVLSSQDNSVNFPVRRRSQVEGVLTKHKAQILNSQKSLESCAESQSIKKSEVLTLKSYINFEGSDWTAPQQQTSLECCTPRKTDSFSRDAISEVKLDIYEVDTLLLSVEKPSTINAKDSNTSLPSPSTRIFKKSSPAPPEAPRQQTVASPRLAPCQASFPSQSSRANPLEHQTNKISEEYLTVSNFSPKKPSSTQFRQQHDMHRFDQLPTTDRHQLQLPKPSKDPPSPPLNQSLSAQRPLSPQGQRYSSTQTRNSIQDWPRRRSPPRDSRDLALREAQGPSSQKPPLPNCKSPNNPSQGKKHCISRAAFPIDRKSKPAHFCLGQCNKRPVLKDNVIRCSLTRQISPKGTQRHMENSNNNNNSNIEDVMKNDETFR